jgi:hypothetical protein
VGELQIFVSGGVGETLGLVCTTLEDQMEREELNSDLWGCIEPVSEELSSRADKGHLEPLPRPQQTYLQVKCYLLCS